MSLFSQRAGLKPAAKSIQHESIDEETRNGLWSVLWNFYQLYYKEEWHHGYGHYPFRGDLENLFRAYWTKYFKRAADTIPEFDNFDKKVRPYFFNASWNEVLDFVEFTTKTVGEKFALSLRKQINDVLEKESSAYRFVGEIVSELTSAEEIQAIDSAIEGSKREVSEHLKKSLQFFSDRKKPDYHNSIKESVSAIEAAAREVSDQNNATLSDAVKLLNKHNLLHPALAKMILDLYGYAGDEGGVRHANKESGKPVAQEEARLILILSAALCGFFTAKASKETA